MTSKMSYCNLCLGSKLKAKTKTSCGGFSWAAHLDGQFCLICLTLRRGGAYEYNLKSEYKGKVNEIDVNQLNAVCLFLRPPTEHEQQPIIIRQATSFQKIAQSCSHRLETNLYLFPQVSSPLPQTSACEIVFFLLSLVTNRNPLLCFPATDLNLGEPLSPSTWTYFLGSFSLLHMSHVQVQEGDAE